MYITYSPKDRRFVSSTFLGSVPIPFVSVKTGRIIELYVNIYRYPCGRLWYQIPCSSFAFSSTSIGLGDVCFQSVSEMLSYTCLPSELLYLRLAIRPYRYK